MNDYKRRKRRSYETNVARTTKSKSKSVVIEMDAYFDTGGMVPRVKVINSSDDDSPNAYMYGVPIEVFGFKYAKGTRFRITCEPLNSREELFKNPLKPSDPPFRVDPNDEEFDEYA